jgi:hypothetical protein
LQVNITKLTAKLKLASSEQFAMTLNELACGCHAEDPPTLKASVLAPRASPDNWRVGCEKLWSAQILTVRKG